jgi:peptidoglycan/xylan/chitin deacetylase (PgdA/CDA1 family)
MVFEARVLHRLVLTFDIEDFINPNAIYALGIILKMLNKYKLKAIFFITGHMAEKLSNSLEILDLLKDHEIGFHSSSHSVRPIISEYTDVESYRQAYLISLERETAHINPLTGRTEGEGGLYFLQDLFSPKKIEAYRAPGMSWTPPHLEALVDLGIKYDFSSNIATSEPVNYKAITFYPYTFTQHWVGSLFDYKVLLYAILRRKVAIFDLHPTLYVNQDLWDSIYYKGNPQTLLRIPKRPLDEVASLFSRFELLLKRVKLLYNTKLVEVDTHLSASTKDLIPNENDMQKCYESSIGWPRDFFGYRPRFIRGYFQEFFETGCC